MARILTTGAEELDFTSVWNGYDLAPNYSGVVSPIVATGPYGSDITYLPRTGRGMYLLTSYEYLRFDFGSDTSKTELFFGFAFRVTAIGTSEFLVAYTDDPDTFSNRLSLRLTSSGGVEVLRSGGAIASCAAGTIAVNTWYYFEVWFKPANSSGRAVVKIDGATVIDFTGDTTNEEEFINAFQFSGVTDGSSTPAGTAFDDIVVNDSSGSVNNTYPGQVRLLPLLPHADGNYGDWTRAGVDLGSDAGQARQGSFEFAMLQTADADDLVTFIPDKPDLPAGAVITNIIVAARARVQDGSGVIAPMVRSGSTDSIASDHTLVSTWRTYQDAWAVNPADAAAWEESDLATLEIGVSS